jgi:hypothetical protein
MKLDFFDCNVQVGRFGNPIPETLFTTSELMQRLNDAGIRRALAFHALSKELHPMEGNPRLAEEIGDHPITPCWVAMPHHAGDMPKPGEFVAQMKAAGAKAVRLFPSLHSYSLSDWCAGELLEAMEAHRVPVLIETGQANYDTVASMMESHPGLRLTMLQTSYRGDRFLYPLFEKYEHLSVETGNYVVTGGIEAVCERFGASRLVFGTGMPFFEPGNAVSLITYAQIADEDKQAIASGNLDRLLAWS